MTIRLFGSAWRGCSTPAVLVCWFGLWGLPVLAQPVASVPHAAPAVRTVDYYGDRSVTAPAVVTRVATAWEAHNSVITMLGFGAHIVATTRYAKDMDAFRRLVPGIGRVPLAISGDTLNMEVLMRVQPQLLFVARLPDTEQLAQLRQAGIAVAGFRWNSMAALRERVSLTAQLLGGTAPARARAYQAYFDTNIAKVDKALATLPSSQRVSLYHAVGSLLTTSGRPSLNQDWMDLAKVRNVAEHWFAGGRMAASAAVTVSMEQVIAADPDIIVTMRASDAREIRSNPQWHHLRAVKSGRVYANPKGLFWWCRETSEQALQFLWLATVAYPEQMKSIDMRAETRYFYRTFYGYELSEAELDLFLSPAD